MTSPNSAAIRRFRYMKRLLFLLCRFPAFNSEFIRDHIDKPDTEPAELEDYKSNCVTAKRYRSLLLVSIYIAWTMKNFYILYVWLNAIHLDHYESNVHEGPLDKRQLLKLNYSASSAALKRVSCFLTNCTRLGPTNLDYGNPYATSSKARLVYDVSRLPLAALCDPWLGDIYYQPVINLDALGILAFLVSMYAHLLLGAWTTIQQMLMPAQNELILFSTSPKVTTNMKRTRARELLRDLTSSYDNYRLMVTRNYTRALSILKNRMKLAGGGDIFSARDSARDYPTSELQSRQSWPRHRHTQLLSMPLSAIYRRRHEQFSFKKPASRSIGEGSELKEEAVSNCIPVTRTEWWRGRVVLLFENSLVLCLIFITAIGIGAFSYIHPRIKQKGELYQRFEQEMNAMDCNIWIERASPTLDKRDALRPGKLDVHWTLFSIIDAVLLSYTGGITVALLLAHYWTIVQDLAVWLAEFRMLMMATLVATRFQHQRDTNQAELEVSRLGESYQLVSESASGGRARDDDEVDLSLAQTGQHHFINTSHFYNIPALRRQFEQSVVLLFCSVLERSEQLHKRDHNSRATTKAHTKAMQERSWRDFRWYFINTKHKDGDYAQRFLAQILFPLPATVDRTGRPARDFDQTIYDVQTLEQIYVNSRLMVEFVEEYRPSMRLAIAITYLLNYGVVVIAVICRIQYPELATETLVLIASASAIANALIIMGADFHANARQLQRLFWSLIAQLTHSQDLRVQHIRSLWIKLTTQLDNQGGLALTAFTMRITYISIIQLMIWTATILALALKSRGLET